MDNLVEVLGVFGDDLMVANAARVSLSKWHDTLQVGTPKEDDARLIKYLAAHGHWTPFSQPQIQLRVKVPIFVARQWTRSNVGTTRNEVSRRYVDSEPEFFFPERWRARPEKSVKQGSGGAMPDEMQPWLDTIAAEGVDEATRTYRCLLDAGVAPEQARMILPQSMFTEWVETGSLYFWARFCNLRLDPHAQKEIRDYANTSATSWVRSFP